MTGPEHYRAGENTLADAQTYQADEPQRLALIAEAQAHFMAAQTAATIDAQYVSDSTAIMSAWAEALS